MVIAAVVISIVVIFGNGRYSFALFSLIPIPIAVAVLKYHLYDLDLVISKTIVFGTLAVFITAIYAAGRWLAGTLVGRRGSLALAAIAAAVIAVAFQPLRERVQHLANRIVYGSRATPYEVLAEFSGRMADAYATEEVPRRMAQILAQGTSARDRRGMARPRRRLHRAARLTGRCSAASLPFYIGRRAARVSRADRAVPVLHRGQLLGR